MSQVNVKQVQLVYQQDNSHKVYWVYLRQIETELYIVVAEYGKVGQSLKSSIKSPEPVALPEAEAIFNQVISQKVKKGYTAVATPGSLEERQVIIERLKSAIAQDFIEGLNSAGLNPKQDLAGLNLSHLDLANANLKNANLENCNLTQSNWSGANLKGANLTGIDLSQVSLLNNIQVDHNTRIDDPWQDLIEQNKANTTAREIVKNPRKLIYANNVDGTEYPIGESYQNKDYLIEAIQQGKTCKITIYFVGENHSLTLSPQVTWVAPKPSELPDLGAETVVYAQYEGICPPTFFPASWGGDRPYQTLLVLDSQGQLEITRWNVENRALIDKITRKVVTRWWQATSFY
ncbi:MAG: pentapeptide repeat-containing protein [Jaaginema sp. PMC 1079.18]|nr:pentapeptide repeat-containing protein [Jaaginema sp. PMC 1080.18]MEC4849904.1 pentapeptide repeat-containing protein [Jaaginema sp. PMC 1079.18]MEC4865983.1 pentapeptide repeat-containing protein [Jaaginema sp. PMC 1078.18]